MEKNGNSYISFEEWCEGNTKEIERQIEHAELFSIQDQKKKEQEELALSYSVYLADVFGLPNNKLDRF